MAAKLTHFINRRSVSTSFIANLAENKQNIYASKLKTAEPLQCETDCWIWDLSYYLKASFLALQVCVILSKGTGVSALWNQGEWCILNIHFNVDVKYSPPCANKLAKGSRCPPHRNPREGAQYTEKGQFPFLERESNYIRKYTNLEIAQLHL